MCILNFFLGFSSRAILAQRSYVVLMSPGGDLIFVSNRKNEGIFRCALAHLMSLTMWFFLGRSSVDISLGKLRVQYDERQDERCVSFCDRLRFQSKGGVAHGNDNYSRNEINESITK